MRIVCLAGSNATCRRSSWLPFVRSRTSAQPAYNAARMRVLMTRKLCWILLLSLLAPSAALAETNITVTRKEPTVKTRLFDPRNRPADMPPLKGDEAALCHYRLGAAASAAASYTERSDGSACSVELTEIEVVLTCDITIWLPEGYSQKIKDHEEAHQQITERIYATSDAYARELAKQAAAKPIKARPGKCKEAADRAMRDANETITKSWLDRYTARTSKVQTAFDRLTDHGRNDLAEDKAIEQAFKQADKG
jgi:hypothetical protein